MGEKLRRRAAARRTPAAGSVPLCCQLFDKTLQLFCGDAGLFVKNII